MKTEKFTHKPFELEAVRVTEENFLDVASWTEGNPIIPTETELETNPKLRKFVKLEKAHHPLTTRLTKAFVGDWVVHYPGKGYKIFTNRAFEKTFDPVIVYTMEDAVAQCGEDVPLAAVDKTSTESKMPDEVLAV